MNARISYCGDLSLPWSVFQPDGGTRFYGPETLGGWVGVAVDTGTELGRYRTYAETRAAHPKAWLSRSAKQALNAGCK